MSAETEFRAMLAAHAGLAALVGPRISQSAVEQGAALPVVVFASRHEPNHALDDTLALDAIDFSIECWGQTAASAAAVAEQVRAAVDAFDLANPTQALAVTSEAVAYDGELALDGVVLTVQWWRQ